jgi:hypothetical protein
MGMVLMQRARGVQQQQQQQQQAAQKCWQHCDVVWL